MFRSSFWVFNAKIWVFRAKIWIFSAKIWVFSATFWILNAIFSTTQTHKGLILESLPPKKWENRISFLLRGPKLKVHHRWVTAIARCAFYWQHFYLHDSIGDYQWEKFWMPHFAKSLTQIPRNTVVDYKTERDTLIIMCNTKAYRNYHLHTWDWIAHFFTVLQHVHDCDFVVFLGKLKWRFPSLLCKEWRYSEYFGPWKSLNSKPKELHVLYNFNCLLHSERILTTMKTAVGTSARRAIEKTGS